MSSIGISGKTSCPRRICNYFDANFDSDVFIFEQNYLAEQQIKLKKNSSVNITVTYMICNDERCLPPIDEELSIKLIIDD